ncbi:DUF4089 domain-containing protein [Kozakia baliensis]|uniref:DUF4089 domain-containing protein n=1 Tax=Kozakia baliensis TaxID=153496 RepID=UPI00089DBEAD|nr:DUF4089 domain-containing protein [Kozakia baliensis]
MTEFSEIEILAQANQLTIDPAYLPEVRANLDLLRRYAALIEGLELPDRLEPAYEYHP